MRARILVSACLIITALAVISLSGASSPRRQSALTYLTEPTLIGSAFVHGPVVFTHDDAKMEKGEPCTTVYLFDPAVGHAREPIASFHCVPRFGTAPVRFTITTRPSSLGYGCVLTSYQFAGDPEIHAVSEPADAH